MNNFYRVIALSFRHKFTVAASLVCSLAVAVLRGGNITAIFPIVDIIMLNKSIPQYLDETTVELEQQIATLTSDVEKRTAALPKAKDAARRQLRSEITYMRAQLARKESQLSWNEGYLAPLA